MDIPLLRRTFITGVLTFIPLWVTWVALSFLFSLVVGVGRPVIDALARTVRRFAPGLADLLLQSWFGTLLALTVVIAGIYVLGWATTNVIGRRALDYFEELLDRIPLVRTIYGSAKTLISAMDSKPAAGLQRVVLIDFPSKEMKAVGFVTRTMKDASTGDDLAIVYVPTTPNPTSGYMEIVPIDRLTPTDWTIEEATRFVITGGTSGPDHVSFAPGFSRPYDPIRRPPQSAPQSPSEWPDGDDWPGTPPPPAP